MEEGLIVLRCDGYLLLLIAKGNDDGDDEGRGPFIAAVQVIPLSNGPISMADPVISTAIFHFPNTRRSSAGIAGILSTAGLELLIENAVQSTLLSEAKLVNVSACFFDSIFLV
jgi:hypothetical protein